MSYPELLEHADCLEIRSPMRVGMPVLLGALGLIPLIAPYELLVKIDWEHYTSPSFFLAATISAGAMTLSALLFFAGFAGLSSKIVFERHAATFSFFSEAPVVGRTQRIQPLSAVRSVEIGVRECSDGAPTYHCAALTSLGHIPRILLANWSADERSGKNGDETLKSAPNQALAPARLARIALDV